MKAVRITTCEVICGAMFFSHSISIAALKQWIKMSCLSQLSFHLLPLKKEGLKCISMNQNTSTNFPTDDMSFYLCLFPTLESRKHPKIKGQKLANHTKRRGNLVKANSFVFTGSTRQTESFYRNSG